MRMNQTLGSGTSEVQAYGAPTFQGVPERGPRHRPGFQVYASRGEQGPSARRHERQKDGRRRAFALAHRIPLHDFAHVAELCQLLVERRISLEDLTVASIEHELEQLA